MKQLTTIVSQEGCCLGSNVTFSDTVKGQAYTAIDRESAPAVASLVLMMAELIGKAVSVSDSLDVDVSLVLFALIASISLSFSFLASGRASFMTCTYPVWISYSQTA